MTTSLAHMPHATPEARAAYQRAYRQRTAAVRAARRPNDDRARHANQRAAEYGIPGRITAADVDTILAPGACHYCHATGPLRLDHVIPLSGGGPNEPANIVPACVRCNASKHTADRPGRWARAADVDACLDCHTTERPHLARGRCGPCYRRAFPPVAPMSARILVGRLRAALAGAEVRRHPNPAAASWRDWHRPDDLEAANALLARLHHHARTFPAPTPLDGPVVRRAALDLLDSVR